jgi:hypothetical protein
MTVSLSWAQIRVFRCAYRPGRYHPAVPVHALVRTVLSAFAADTSVQVGQPGVGCEANVLGEQPRNGAMK